MLQKMYQQAEERGRPQPPDPSHPDACPVLAYRDPLVHEMMDLYGPYTQHGILYKYPPVIEAQPNRYWEAMQLIGSVAGDRQKARMERD